MDAFNGANSKNVKLVERLWGVGTYDRWETNKVA
jgi:hypothetical protein